LQKTNPQGWATQKRFSALRRGHPPKALIILDGSAHAQFLFQTDQGERVMREILHFLSAK
jgi:hypothetical protein